MAKKADAHRFQHSFSKLELVEKCPGAFRLRHMDKVAERPNIPRDRGKLFHEIAHQYLVALVDRGLGQDVGLMREIAGAAIKAQDYLPSSCNGEVMEMAETLAVTFNLDVEHFTDSERFFTVRIGEARYVFRGLMDLEIHDGSTAIIVDWKTAWEIEGESKLRADPQVGYYALATIIENPEIETVRVMLGFVRFGAYPYVDFTREELEPVQAELESAIEKLEARTDWPFTPGSFCGMCDYATPELCPAMKAALETGAVRPIVTAADAEVMAAEITLLDRHRKDCMEQLRGWATVQGPVRSGDMVYAHHETRYKTRDPRLTAQVLKDGGIDPFDALKVDNKALDKATKGRPDLAPAIAAATKEQSFTRFEAKKFRGEEESE